jgi:hypothetical protein
MRVNLNQHQKTRLIFTKESCFFNKFVPSVDLNTATEEMNRIGWVKSKLKKSKIGKNLTRSSFCLLCK